jgi:hypothetical protein
LSFLAAGTLSCSGGYPIDLIMGSQGLWFFWYEPGMARELLDGRPEALDFLCGRRGPLLPAVVELS